MLADIQIDYYVDKMNKLTEKLNKEKEQQQQQEDPLLKLREVLEKWPPSTLIPTFRFKYISLLEMSQLVTGLSNSSSFGQDEIDSTFLKLILPSILKPLRHLVNTSLQSSTFANKWRITKVHPLLKDKDLDKLDPTSYHPKGVERATQLQLLQFFETTEQWNDSGHSYRQGLSTTTTIAEISNAPYSATEDRMITEIMTLDQSAAFDCLNIEILLSKMRLYIIEEDVINWL